MYSQFFIIGSKDGSITPHGEILIHESNIPTLLLAELEVFLKEKFDYLKELVGEESAAAAIARDRSSAIVAYSLSHLDSGMPIGYDVLTPGRWVPAY